MLSYLCNQRSKQTNLVDLQFLSYYSLFQKLVQKTVKKGTSNMKVIPLNCRLSGHPEIFKVKLYYFQERLSLRYNTESCFLKQPNQNAQMK